ncbi:hypothetical protein J3458_019819 [Metarhizium acridum]|uniref:uncharacterized protein n=1 Tax=Metarhizium acridum TaxID=92637 RepID=UPI001C6BE056|nr:hypothetical protein J3458_019819 [Metarhizium acridum]
MKKKLRLDVEVLKNGSRTGRAPPSFPTSGNGSIRRFKGHLTYSVTNYGRGRDTAQLAQIVVAIPFFFKTLNTEGSQPFASPIAASAQPSCRLLSLAGGVGAMGRRETQ